MTSIARHNAANAASAGHALKSPALPSIVPAKRPIAPVATKTPGAAALRGVKFKQMLPPPTWNKALPSPAKTATALNEYGQQTEATPVSA